MVGQTYEGNGHEDLLDRLERPTARLEVSKGNINYILFQGLATKEITVVYHAKQL